MQAVWWASQRVGWTEARVIFAKKTNRCVSLKCTARLPGVFSVSLRCLLTPRWLLGVSQVSCHQVAGSKSHLCIGGSYPTAPSCLTSCLDCPTSWLELMTQNISLQALATTLLLSCFNCLTRWSKQKSSLLGRTGREKYYQLSCICCCCCCCSVVW